MVPVFWVLAFLLSACFSSPVPRHHYRNSQEHVKYDQRQEGEFNVRADLENFVILLIPTSPVSSAPPTSSSPSLGLLDLLSKSIPLRAHMKRNKHVKKDGQDLQNPLVESFIESKTAPYHVDIDEDNSGEEAIVANSAPISIVKKQDQVKHPELNAAAARLSRAFVITVPLEETIHKKNAEITKKETKKEPNKKKQTKESNEMKLLGAENEQCGPGLSRDDNGICRVNKV